MDLNETCDAFMSISGHVDWVDVKVYDGKWSYEKAPVFNKRVDYIAEATDEEDPQEVEAYTLEKLDKFIEELETLKGETK